MILPKEEGGLGVRNLDMIAKASSIKKIANIWEKPSILSTWMRSRYIRNRVLQNIQPRAIIDSIQWKYVLGAKEPINQFQECRFGNRNTWKIRGKRNLGGIVEGHKTKNHKDPLAKGIVSNMPMKY